MVGATILLAAPAPGVLRGAETRPVQVSVFGTVFLIEGTPTADRVRIDRLPGGGQFVITADSPVQPHGRCNSVETGTVRCTVAHRRKNGPLITLGGGPDNAQIAAHQYGISYFDGGAGADHLVGGRFNDLIFGYGGDDRIRGRAGQDLLGGAGGDDRLDGGYGRDGLSGGGGRDVCLGGPGRDSRVSC